MMKIRESGMPEEDRWKAFFNPDFILGELGLDRSSKLVVDLGCGYGTFSIPAARHITGTVYAMDIDSIQKVKKAATRVKTEATKITIVAAIEKYFWKALLTYSRINDLLLVKEIR